MKTFGIVANIFLTVLFLSPSKSFSTTVIVYVHQNYAILGVDSWASVQKSGSNVDSFAIQNKYFKVKNLFGAAEGHMIVRKDEISATLERALNDSITLEEAFVWTTTAIQKLLIDRLFLLKRDSPEYYKQIWKDNNFIDSGHVMGFYIIGFKNQMPFAYAVDYTMAKGKIVPQMAFLVFNGTPQFAFAGETVALKTYVASIPRNVDCGREIICTSISKEVARNPKKVNFPIHVAIIDKSGLKEFDYQDKCPEIR